MPETVPEGETKPEVRTGSAERIDLMDGPKGSSTSKITLFMGELSGGGAERAMVNLANGFSLGGVAVDLVLASARGPYLEELEAAVNIVDLKSGSVSRGLPRLVRYLRERRPAALLSTLNHANLVAILAKHLSGIPVRVVVREADTLSQFRKSGLKARMMPFLARILYPRSDRVIAVSRGVANDLHSFIGLPWTKLATIYNPVVTEDLHTKAQEVPEHPWFHPDSPPVILGAGRLTAQKDFPTLIRAFSLVREKMACRLVILGEGEDRPELERLVSQLGLEQDVNFLGFVANPFAYMARAAVFVLSSRWEGLPGVLIQAMACGCPVVSTDCPSGPDEVLEDGRYGALVPVGEPVPMAEAIIKTMETPISKGVLRGRSNVFSLEDSVKAYLEVLLG